MPPLQLYNSRYRPLKEFTPRCRVPQAFDLPTMPTKRPACAAESGPQVCRKKDPFSPQARWGDDGARRVLKHVTALNVARQLPELAAVSLALSWLRLLGRRKHVECPVLIDPRSPLRLP